jgi:antirestriction protein ArdC
MSKAYDVITDRILTLLEQGTVPWRKPWNVETGLPRNLCSQRPYTGINVWLLGSMHYQSPFWATFHQIKAAGGSVRKGEHGCPVIFWKVYDKDTASGDEPEKRFVLRYFTVFNTAQVDGLAVPTLDTTAPPFTPIERCETLLAHIPQRPAITHGSTQACYRPSSDTVHMPDPTTFTGSEQYYSTLFHELTHSTGHASRLNRATLVDMVPFGTVCYAKEELVAEMGAAYLCGVCGIANTTVDQSAAYLKGWLKALRHDPKMIIQAAGQAQKAVDWLQGLHEYEDA